MAAMTDAPKIPKTVRGKRPEFHDNASIDRAIAMMLTLAQEVSVLRDRVDTLEQLGTQAGWLKPGAADRYAPPPEVKAAREARREAYLDRLFYILREELEDLERGDTEEAYWKAAEISEKG
jgi:hypothetical protein